MLATLLALQDECVDRSDVVLLLLVSSLKQGGEVDGGCEPLVSIEEGNAQKEVPLGASFNPVDAFSFLSHAIAAVRLVVLFADACAVSALCLLQLTGLETSDSQYLASPKSSLAYSGRERVWDAGGAKTVSWRE